MPFHCYSTEETENLIKNSDILISLKIAEYGEYGAKTFIRVQRKDYKDGLAVYVPKRLTVMDSLGDVDWDQYLDPADQFDDYLRAVEAVPGSQIIEIQSNHRYDSSYIGFVAPKIGYIRLVPAIDVSPEPLIKKISRETRQDAEGRTITGLAAKILAIPAKSEEDLETIIDAVFLAGNLKYRGIDASLDRDGNIFIRYNQQGVELTSDAIEIPDLPETIRMAIKGKTRRNMEDIIEIPGFDDMEIANISFDARARFTAKGKNWVRLDIRNDYGAKFQKVEIEEAKEIALETYRKRHP